MDTLHFAEEPIRLNSTRAWRPYLGGKKLEEWLGTPNPADGKFPEEWVASVTQARNAGREEIVEGLTTVSLGEGEVTLRDLIGSAPAAFLGAEHVRKYGANTAVLAKVLDSQCRLPIQVHPDRDFSRQRFHSRFGKTEAWYIMEGRTIAGVEPYLLFGFKPGVTREQWQELFYRQDLSGMIDCLHRVPAIPGDLWLIEGGIPHAIGSGCFLIEIQEPTDYTFRVERTLPWGDTVPDAHCHQGLGFEAMFDCFDYHALTAEETRNRWRIEPKIMRQTPDGIEKLLVGAPQTDKFSLTRLEVAQQMKFAANGGFSVLIVLQGSGAIRGGPKPVKLGKADRFFLPAGLGEFTIERTSPEELIIIRCYPPF